MWQLPPMPATYEEACEEIARLYKRLHDANQKWAKAVEKGNNDRKSLKGMLELATCEAEGWKAEAERLKKDLEEARYPEKPYRTDYWDD